MVSRVLVLASAILCFQLNLATGQANPPVFQTYNVRTVPRETLTDLAVAFADPSDPVIYYNPRLMAQYGVELSAFVLAHEYAHIQLGHRRPAEPEAGAGESLQRLLQGWELDADCIAAAWLARERPSALRAAIGFFERMGADRVDLEHPTGTARATQLASCGQMRNGDPRLMSEGPRTSATATQFR